MPFQIFRTVETVHAGTLAVARFVQRVARWGGGANVTRTAADVSSPGRVQGSDIVGADVEGGARGNASVASHHP